MSARTAFLATLLLYAGVVLGAWSTFPERVPAHWNGGGDVDRVLPRGQAVLELALLGGFVALGLYLLLMVGYAANSALRRYRPHPPPGQPA